MQVDRWAACSCLLTFSDHEAKCLTQWQPPAEGPSIYTTPIIYRADLKWCDSCRAAREQGHRCYRYPVGTIPPEEMEP